MTRPIKRLTNSVDPDKTGHYEPSHVDLHYLQRSTGLNSFKKNYIALYHFIYSLAQAIQLLLFPFSVLINDVLEFCLKINLYSVYVHFKVSHDTKFSLLFKFGLIRPLLPKKETFVQCSESGVTALREIIQFTILRTLPGTIDRLISKVRTK